MAVFELYSLDAHLQNSSKCLLDSFSSKEKAIEFAKKDSASFKEELSQEEIKFLKFSNQTQGRKENYLIIKNKKLNLNERIRN